MSVSDPLRSFSQFLGLDLAAAMLGLLVRGTPPVEDFGPVGEVGIGQPGPVFHGHDVLQAVADQLLESPVTEQHALSLRILDLRGTPKLDWHWLPGADHVRVCMPHTAGYVRCCRPLQCQRHQ